ncbi:protein SON isoform X2 [Echeneis naucrates]|uniref:protein SON isoform X2 n=1 Tax=Echeneis naucrates TaxID=173247 RepID=UPI001113E53B|nr:protein SON-like isoform X2 [Echeneis naucrates]
MAANIEQIFQDFILSKIREIENQNEDKCAGEGVVAAREMDGTVRATSEIDKQEDCVLQKRHKKQKKHKNKKKKKNREKEQKESSSEPVTEVEREVKHKSRRGTTTEVKKEQGEDKKVKSKSHKRHLLGKRKKKKRRRKDDENSSDSDSECVSKQKESKSQNLTPRCREELPDIIPKQDSSNKERREEESHGGSRCCSRSQLHSDYHTHSCSVWRSSHSRCRHRLRRPRTSSLSSSWHSRTRSSSSEGRKKGALGESTQSPKGPSKSLQPPQSASSPTQRNATTEVVTESSTSQHFSYEPYEKPVEGKQEKAAMTTHKLVAGCDPSKSLLNQSILTEPGQTTEPSFPLLKTSKYPRYPARNDESLAKKSRPPKSPQRNREGKSPKRQKRSKSPCRSHRKGSRSRSTSRRSRSRSGGRRSRRSRSMSVSRGRRRATYSQRDRWKREPSHSPVLILRKNRSPTRKHCTSTNSPQRISELDKEQLLEIAKANAAAMCAKAATMTAALSNMSSLSSMLSLPSITNNPLTNATQPSITALEEVKRKAAKQANSISIKEFTDKCKMIVDSKGELPMAVPHVSDEEDDGKPFGGSALREQKAISFSINNITVRPAVRSDAGIAKEFPVSSGSQHRKREGEALGAYGEWVPVDKTADKAATTSKKMMTIAPSVSETSSSGDAAAAVSPEAVEHPIFVPASDSVFPDPLLQPVDISQAVTERIKAQRRLAENPYDVSAICMLSRAQEQVDAWAQSNTVPGLFTGSTGAQVLSSEELSTSGPQAWLKKDQFLRAAPVSGGVGEFLMRKMGWKTGEGLGRNREGTVEPIIIDFKVDRKGLVAEGEKPQKQTGGLVVTKDLMGKHPVSALIELCNKRRIMQPDFVMVHHSGPDHRKNFLFKVTVNGVDYQPQTASPNKKHAKAMAATVALQALGEVPVDGPGLYTGPVFTAASTGPLFST